MRRAAYLMILGFAILAGAGVAALASSSGPARPGASSPAGGSAPTRGSAAPIGASPGAGSGASPVSPGVTAAATPGPTPAPTPTPSPTFASRLTGLAVTQAKSKRHPIAVMIDDHWDARPQSSFNEAGIVWHALAEGGIPRYMLIFGDGNPSAVGPVRSARQYYIEWAAEWRAVYVHAGGSPQALATLRAKGDGTLVYNADDFRWEGRYLWRDSSRFAPHNVYTDGANLRALGKRLGAKDVTAEPFWQFAPDAPLALRPTGGVITVRYPTTTIAYKYDRTSNTYRRLVEGKPHVDAADGSRVAPRNVVVMVVKFGQLNDGHPEKGRLEAEIVGSGRAWISTNGITTKGTWRKQSVKGPTMFFDAAGNEVVLTAGQTFIQVIAKKGDVTLAPGAMPGAATASPSPSVTP